MGLFDYENDNGINAASCSLQHLLRRSAFDTYEVLKSAVEEGTAACGGGDDDIESFRVRLWQRIRQSRELMLQEVVLVQLCGILLKYIDDTVDAQTAIYQVRDNIRKASAEFASIQFGYPGLVGWPEPPPAVDAAIDVLATGRYLRLPKLTQLAVRCSDPMESDIAVHLDVTDEELKKATREMTKFLKSELAATLTKSALWNRKKEGVLKEVVLKVEKGRVIMISPGEYEIELINDFKAIQILKARCLLGSSIGQPVSVMHDIEFLNTMQSASNVVLHSKDHLKRRLLYEANSFKELARTLHDIRGHIKQILALAKQPPEPSESVFNISQDLKDLMDIRMGTQKKESSLPETMATAGELIAGELIAGEQIAGDQTTVAEQIAGEQLAGDQNESSKLDGDSTNVPAAEIGQKMEIDLSGTVMEESLNNSANVETTKKDRQSADDALLDALIDPSVEVMVSDRMDESSHNKDSPEEEIKEAQKMSFKEFRDTLKANERQCKKIFLEKLEEYKKLDSSDFLTHDYYQYLAYIAARMTRCLAWIFLRGHAVRLVECGAAVGGAYSCHFLKRSMNAAKQTGIVTAEDASFSYHDEALEQQQVFNKFFADGQATEYGGIFLEEEPVLEVFRVAFFPCCPLLLLYKKVVDPAFCPKTSAELHLSFSYNAQCAELMVSMDALEPLWRQWQALQKRSSSEPLDERRNEQPSEPLSEPLSKPLNDQLSEPKNVQSSEPHEEQSNEPPKEQPNEPIKRQLIQQPSQQPSQQSSEPRKEHSSELHTGKLMFEHIFKRLTEAPSFKYFVYLDATRNQYKPINSTRDPRIVKYLDMSTWIANASMAVATAVVAAFEWALNATELPVGWVFRSRGFGLEGVLTSPSLECFYRQKLQFSLSVDLYTGAADIRFMAWGKTTQARNLKATVAKLDFSRLHEDFVAFANSAFQCMLLIQPKTFVDDRKRLRLSTNTAQSSLAKPIEIEMVN